MTVEAWVMWVISTIVFITVVMMLASNFGKTGKLVSIATSILVSAILLVGMLWWFGNTASGSRALKTQQSNFTNGINRKVTVYDMNGGVVQEYEGRFDIEYDDDRILFDDENGLRHIIYYPTGTVIVDEVEK